MSYSPSAPREFSYEQLTSWFSELGVRETHEPEHYDLAVSIDPAAGTLEVSGTVRVRPSGGAGGTTRGEGARIEGARGEIAFLLDPNLSLDGPAAPGQPPSGVGTGPRSALRVLPLAPGATELRLDYHGRLPQAWISPESVELALYNLWYPLFSSRLPPFTFRVRLELPRDAVPAMSGRLAPLAAELASKAHDDTGPRVYVWESTCPTMDIALCAGPYLVHQRVVEAVLVEVFALADDYVLGEPFLDWAERALRVLVPWFGPLGTAASRLGIVITPISNWGGYARPNHLVMPRPMAADIHDPAEARGIALWLVHEIGHLWFGATVLSDNVNEVWMSEAFAEFARLVFEEAVWGGRAYRERLAAHRRAAASAADPRPMADVKVSHPEMDALARKRGAVMLAELRALLGDAVMAGLLSGFVARHAGKFTRGEEFVAEASRVAGRDLRGFFATYLEKAPDPEPAEGARPDSGE